MSIIYAMEVIYPISTESVFRKHLKTHFFCSAFNVC